MTTRMSKSYLELIQLPTFKERYLYLQIKSKIGDETFGSHRYLNQVLYHSEEWKRTKNRIIIRDNGCDLGVDGFEIFGKVLVHHINPITIEDIINRDPIVFDPNNLISTTLTTHNAIHYGDDSLLITPVVERSRNDTCPWRK